MDGGTGYATFSPRLLTECERCQSIVRDTNNKKEAHEKLAGTVAPRRYAARLWAVCMGARCTAAQPRALVPLERALLLEARRPTTMYNAAGSRTVHRESVPAVQCTDV